MRALILGAGAMGHAHAETLLRMDPEVTLTWVVSLHEDEATTFAEDYDVPNAGTDLAAALDTGDVDVVHVCAPPSAHVPAAVTALRHDCHVVLEKPPALSLAEMDEVIAAEATSNASATVIVQHRFGNGAQHLSRLLAHGAIGRPLFAESRTLWFRDAAYFSPPWRGRWETEGGGVTMNHAIHQIDLLSFLLGPWREVVAVAARQHLPTSAEDVSVAMIRFDNGVVASVANSLLSPRQLSAVRIDTDFATVELEHLYGYDDSNWRFTPAPDHERLARLWPSDPSSPPTSHLAQLRPTYEALRAGTPPPVTLADARQTLELIAAMYKSSFTGQAVRRGEIAEDDPFMASMRGDGAPWDELDATSTDQVTGVRA